MNKTDVGLLTNCMERSQNEAQKIKLNKLKRKIKADAA
jgi:hypothetical protein